MLPKATPKSKSGGRCGASEASRSSPPDLLFGVGLCVASRSWDQYPDDFFDLLFGMGLCVLSRSWDQYPDEFSDFFCCCWGREASSQTMFCQGRLRLYGRVGGERTESLILHRQSTQTRFWQGSTVRWVVNRRNVGFYWAGVGAVQPKGPMCDVSHGLRRNLAAGSPFVTPAGKGGGCPITDEQGRGGCCPSTDRRERGGCCPSTDQ